MKKKKITLELAVGIASLFVSTISLVWIGGFQVSALVHDVQDVKEDIKQINLRLDKMDARFEKMDAEFHKMDLRVSTLEQHKY